MTEIASAIRQISGVHKASTVNMEECSVVSYDEATRTCIVTSTSGKGQIERTEVRLMADIDDGILYLPAVDSSVIVAYSDFVAPFVMYFSELDKVLQIVGDSAIEIEPDLIQLNDGAYGGLIKIEQLIDRLNKVETALSDLITKYNSHVHTGVTTGGGSSGTTPAISTQVVTNTERDFIENKNIVHGGSV